VIEEHASNRLVENLVGQVRLGIGHERDRFVLADHFVIVRDGAHLRKLAVDDGLHVARQGCRHLAKEILGCRIFRAVEYFLHILDGHIGIGITEQIFAFGMAASAARLSFSSISSTSELIPNLFSIDCNFLSDSGSGIWTSDALLKPSALPSVPTIRSVPTLRASRNPPAISPDVRA